MKVAIVGYGQMGREIEKILPDRNHSVACRIDPVDPAADSVSLTTEHLAECDVAIEFSLGEGVLGNAKLYAATGTPAVVGTTGWEAQRQEVAALFAETGAFLWGSNFSIGAHVFFRLVEAAAAMVDGTEAYDILAYEIHHRNKKDSPSGTALAMAEHILRGSTRKTEVITSRLDRKIEPSEVHVASVRGGSIAGIHNVILDSEVDSIEIKHSAKNRGGFALGAVMAAEWLTPQRGFFTIEDFVSATLR